ncbi:MAG: hypothetical protein MUF02_08885 [Acidobacteria bacterium]|jgi:hypothetical protein|nr:hypothetical protein [Acidobacteriota bacterium]
MKRKTGSVLCLAVLLLPLASCRLLRGPNYDLLVTIESGVTGTPASGLYSYKDLEEVEYKYTPVDSRHAVEVLVDGGQEVAEASLTIYHNTVLVARLIDVRDDWEVTSIDASDAKTTFTLTFAGADILGGTFSDSRGYRGTWSGVGGAIEIVYSDWEAYVYSGSLFYMSGTWANGSATGSWSAKRTE